MIRICRNLNSPKTTEIEREDISVLDTVSKAEQLRLVLVGTYRIYKFYLKNVQRDRHTRLYNWT